MERSDTITIVIPATCNECGCKVFPETVGFENATTTMCKKCYNKGVEELRIVEKF